MGYDHTKQSEEHGGLFYRQLEETKCFRGREFIIVFQTPLK